MIRLDEYSKTVGKEVISNIQEKAESLSERHILCISSTYQGGGVAEILNSVVVLFNEIGLDFGWRILHGSPDFFTITKKLHNSLQGERINFSERKKRIYLETNRRFSVFTHIDHDLVVVHDPQPLPLVMFYKKKQPWIFRCHIDLSNPNLEVWNYLKGIIEKYDQFVVSRDSFKRDLSIPTDIIHPAIDPLSTKNKAVSEKNIEAFLSKHGIFGDKPIISQISRFDKWKDPIGVVKVFETVRKKVDCQLVLLGSLALDDPEGQKIFEAVERYVEKCRFNKDIRLLLVDNDFLVNCLQRKSKVVLQKSLKEGFGLTVSEALYKRTPVVASNVGGIPLQIIDGVNGFLHDPKDIKGFGASVVKLLKDEELRLSFGNKGREHVKNNFLVTGLMLNWLNLFEKHLKQSD